MCVCVLLHRGGVVNQGLRSWSTPGVWGSAVRKAERALPPQNCRVFFMADPLCFIRNMHIIALRLCLPKPVNYSHVVVLPIRGRTADSSLSHNNSYPFKSSWLKYINLLFFFHACGQVSRCFQHLGWNHKRWDKLGPLEVCVRLDAREKLPSPMPALLPQHRQLSHSIAVGRRRRMPEPQRGDVPYSTTPQLPHTYSWLLGCSMNVCD